MLTITPDRLERALAYLVQQASASQIPGLALAVVQGKEVLLTGAAGLSTPGGARVTPETLFQIGSLTKGFTALAILQLRDRGLLELDAPVRRYLPWFALADEEAGAAITVRHLLDQVSGFPMGDWKVALQEPALRSSLERGVRALRRVRPAGPPGQKWAYANMNYNTLGLIIEAVTGEPYQKYIQGQILRPLGMKWTCFHVTEARDHALPHVTRFGRVQQIEVTDDPWSAPAGLGMASSATELARWLLAHLGHGPAEVISPVALAESHAGGIATLFPGLEYGRGWFTADFHGSRLIYNHGGTAGFSAVICLLPEHQLGVAALFNRNPGIATRVGMGVLGILMGRPAEQTDPMPDFGQLFRTSMLTMGATGLALLAGLGVWVASGLAIPAWLTLVAAVLALMVWALPAMLRRSYAFPLPPPLNIGPGGWAPEMALGWLGIALGLTGWAVLGLLRLAGLVAW